MNELGVAAQNLNTLIRPIVMAIVKEIHPKDDEISIRKAYAEYGRTWIDSQRRAENLRERNRGNRVVLSRSEIENLKAAEYDTPHLVFRANGTNGYSVRHVNGKLVVRKKATKKKDESCEKTMPTTE